MINSQYADRPTLGSIALESAKDYKNNPCAGDLGSEMMKSLVEDLNQTIQSNPYDGKDFYIIIHEKKDMQLKNVILRRMITTPSRPYPEPNTSVFWTDPKSQTTRFCWSLPHQTSFTQYLLNPHLYTKEQIADIKAYNAEDLKYFGFHKSGKVVRPIKNWQDRKLKGS
jgi:hypothetical protein